MTSNIEKNVMGSVAAIYAARLLMSMTALKMYVLLLSLLGLTFLVSLPNVAANLLSVAAGNPLGVVAFFISAVLGTTLLVQLSLALGVAALFSLVLEGVRVAGRRALPA